MPESAAFTFGKPLIEDDKIIARPGTMALPYAPDSANPHCRVPFVETRPQPGTGLQPVVLQLGLLDNIVCKPEIIKAFADQGCAASITGQASQVTPYAKPGQPPSILASIGQASHEVMEARGWYGDHTAFIGYSAGLAILASNILGAEAERAEYFQGVPLVALAPSCLTRVPYSRQIGRALHDAAAFGVERQLTPAGPTDNSRSGSRTAAMRNMVKHVARHPVSSFEQFVEVCRKQVDTARLADAVGWLAVGAFATDATVPMAGLDNALTKLLRGNATRNNVSYFVPYASTTEAVDGLPLGARQTRHLDLVNNPERIAAAVASQLNQYRQCMDSAANSAARAAASMGKISA